MENFNYEAYYAFISSYECSLCDRKIEIGKVLIKTSSNLKKVSQSNKIINSSIFIFLSSLVLGNMLNAF